MTDQRTGPRHWSPAPHASLLSRGHVAVIGGGPGGSAFALFALHYARQAGLDLSVTIFEPRDFERPGPWGCNMCAGLVPVRELRGLSEIGLELPARLIRNQIGHYTMHTAAGRIQVPQPDPDGNVYSVYRGNGPRDGPLWPEPVGLDAFLLAAARSRGADVVAERVTAVSLNSRPTVATAGRTYDADLVVLAAGVNQRTVSFDGLGYGPPVKQQMAQTEFCPGEEAVKAALADSVHVFLPRDGSFIFGTLAPKGPCVSVSLLGQHLRPGILESFLTQPEVAALIPENGGRACGCRPHIAVGPARPLYAHRFVAVGDAGITRLYKNGIGSALRTGQQAAYAAVCHGVGAADFRRHYGPLCRGIALDNLAGRFLVNFTRVFQRHRRLSLPHLRAIAEEQDLPVAQRLHSRLLWGMFTGTYPYRQLLAVALRPDLHLRLGRHLVRDLTGPGDAG